MKELGKGFGLNLAISGATVVLFCPKCGANGKAYYDRNNSYKCGNCNTNLILQGGKLVASA